MPLAMYELIFIVCLITAPEPFGRANDKQDVIAEGPP